MISYTYQKFRKVQSRGKHSSLKKGALFWNSLENTNSMNSDLNHWRNNRISDMSRMEKMFPSIEKIVDFSICKSIIDVGCGSASLLTLIKQKYHQIDCTGTDFSESKIKFCAQFEPNAKYFAHSIYNPIPNSYDYAFCLEVLEHLERPRLAVSQFVTAIQAGILKKVILTVPNGRIDTFAGHIHFWSPESWSLFLSDYSESSINISHGQFLDNKYNYAVISGE